VQLNWTTFLLEIVNFLILIWILKRFLYKPVLEAIARRKVAIDKTLTDAKARQDEARTLEEQYRNRLAAWENEKTQLRTKLQEEMNAQRGKMTTALDESLAQERERQRAVEQRRIEELERQVEEESRTKGAQFTARLLTRLASPDLEAKIVDLVLEEISVLPPEQAKAIKAAARNGGRQVRTTSAFPLAATQRGAISQKLRTALDDQVTVDFREDSGLLAGLRIGVGPWVLHANIEDELRFFAEGMRNESENR
jgi:F-type H+-transporting ATPase subunit b